MSILRWTAALVLLAVTACDCATRVSQIFPVRRDRETAAQPGDLRMRHNEMLCVHRGVNPFRIWNREIEDAEFRGLPRPDMDGHDTVLDYGHVVHAYPPWHTTFFWWYGWLSYSYVVAVFFLLSGLSLAVVFGFFRKHQPEEPSARALYWSLLSYFYVDSIVFVVMSGNYGGLIAGLVALFLIAEKKNQSVISGLLWAVMMIKPQLAVLLFWPLLFQRRFATIGIAVGTCLVAIALPSVVLHESPVELIRQTLVQGLPYVTTPVWWVPIDRWVGGCSNLVRLGLFSVLCGWVSWRVRNVKPEMFRYVVPFVVLPVCFYCPVYDYVVTWLAAALVLAWLHELPRRGLMLFLACLLPCATFKSAWWAARRFLGFCPAGVGWIYHAVDLIFLSVCAVAFFKAIRHLEHTGYPQFEVGES